MIIDCDSCAVRGLECGDCVVTVLLRGPADLDAREQAAIAVLAEAGMLPPLRLVAGGDEAEVTAVRPDDARPDAGLPEAGRHRAAG
jgi:hypothetical protein